MQKAPPPRDSSAVPLGTGLHRLEEIGVFIGSRQHDHADIRHLRRDQPGRGEPIHLRHIQVHQHDLWSMKPGKLNRLIPVPCLSQDLNPLRLEQASQSVSK